MELLDLIFPKRCINCKKSGSYLCSKCFAYLSFDTKSLCLVCNKPSYNGLTHPICKKTYSIDGCFSAVSYNNVAQKLIYSFKYKPYITDLKKFLADLFYESIIQNEDFMKQVYSNEFIFVPIPLYSSKLRKRGYNQSEILAKMIAKNFKSSVVDILERTRDTKTQFKLRKIDREENIKGAFRLKSGLEVKNKNTFLVDDIVTTGSTLKEATKVLKMGGANKVFGLTFARD